ncbi:hypothetical protein PENSOL_c014G08424 [Penicillium solitum]|uniref:Uncharacterized protein n=1 Tax=Penicillium solitum TaxID=60172 RepID=A0A1V6R5P1_9EURO|nr:uncharacterized protein PENSOL_c014G08424 [Penicillium solitum]OQD96815.1 hypothetical protein PENSOL_c014G08424 [Penicillium solitum]
MSRSDLKRLSVQECIDTFAQDYVSGQRMLVLVTDDPMPDGEPLAFMGLLNPSRQYYDGDSFLWMCTNTNDLCTKDIVNEMVDGEEWIVYPVTIAIPWIHAQIPTENGFRNVSLNSWYPTTPDTQRLKKLLYQASEDEVQAALDDPSNWTNASFAGNVTIFTQLICPSPHRAVRLAQTRRIGHCLTVPRDESCRMMFSPPICLLVIGCNLVKLICALLTARDDREELFLTIGDAIASYLACPDPTTEGGCLLSKWLVVKGSQGWRRKAKRKDKMLQYTQSFHFNYLPENDGIYGLTVATSKFSNLSRETIWDNSLGEARPSTSIGMPDIPGATGTFVMILLPNVLQLFASIAYFILNAPRDTQRSTYYLSLPYRYSFPLLVASAVLHWLVSESFFFVAILFAIIVICSLLLVLILLGLRRFESPMPLVAQCSAAISAACHPMTSSMDDTANHALKPVQWGEIPGIYSDRGLMVFSHRINGDEDASGRESGNEELQHMLPNADLNDLTRTGAAISQLYHCTFTSEDTNEQRTLIPPGPYATSGQLHDPLINARASFYGKTSTAMAFRDEWVFAASLSHAEEALASQPTPRLIL